jgi:hypothetical protein
MRQAHLGQRPSHAAKEQQREMRLAYYAAHPEFRERNREVATAQWRDPTMRKKMTQRIQEKVSLPEARKRQSSISKEVCNRPQARRQNSRLHKRLWKEGRYDALRVPRPPEVSKKIRESLIRGVRLLRGQDYYNPHWPETKLLLHQRQGSKCLVCDRNIDPLHDRIAVHHNNENPRDNRLNNFTLLHFACHRKAHMRGMRFRVLAA